MTLATVDWTQVLLALIAACASVASAGVALLVRKEIHTSNGKTLAETVEQTHATTADTNAIVKRTIGERDGNHAAEPGAPDTHKRADDD